MGVTENDAVRGFAPPYLFIGLVFRPNWDVHMIVGTNAPAPPLFAVSLVQ